MYDKDIQNILDKLDIFEKAFDQIRLVDPTIKKIVEYKNEIINQTNLSCFGFWGKNKMCDNCISMRAYRENDTFIKMEYTQDEIFMITAIPITLGDRIVVIELMKNITNSVIIDSNINGLRTDIHAMIDSMNNIALKDSLTGIYNRRYINEKLPINLVNAALANYRITIIMADIDFFKTVNDTYGHLVGDYTLQFFTNILSKNLKRESDWVARYGGEEFIICLPGAGISYAAEIAENMRKTVENSEVNCGIHKFKITASFGVSSMKPTINSSIEELIENADSKLYKAKHNGRNRVEI